MQFLVQKRDTKRSLECLVPTNQFQEIFSLPVYTTTSIVYVCNKPLSVYLCMYFSVWALLMCCSDQTKIGCMTAHFMRLNTCCYPSPSNFTSYYGSLVILILNNSCIMHNKQGCLYQGNMKSHCNAMML